MSAHLDSFEPGLAFGWATNPDNIFDHPEIRVSLSNEVITSTRANIFRADLKAAGIGDGHHGFSLHLDFDNFFKIIERLDELSIDAVSLETGESWKMIINQNVANAMRAANKGFNGVRIVGSSYLMENIVKFGRNALEGTESEPVATYVAFRMHAFHSGHWVQNNDLSKPTARYWLGQLGPQTIERIKSNSLKILFDMSNEGMCFEYSVKSINALLKELKAMDLKPSSCAFITQNRVMERDYLIWSFREGHNDTLGMFCYDYYVRKFVGIRSTDVSNADQDAKIEEFRRNIHNPRNKRFICLNFTPRPHRIAVVSWLLEKGFDKVGYLSFKGLNMLKLDASDYQMPDWFPEMDITRAGYEKLKGRGTIDLDLAQKAGHYIPEFDLGPETLFADSYFSIVTETDAQWGTLRRLTEKILKPIASFHPFIVIGNGQTLHLLRSLGFKTFDPWIDEDYDIMDDPRKRVDLALQEIKKLIYKDTDQIKTFLEELEEILVFNYRHLHTLLEDEYRLKTEPNLLRALKDFASKPADDTTSCLPATIPDRVINW